MKNSLGAKTLVFPTPAWVIGSYDKEGRPNLMTAAWCGICCSNPPCVCVSLREATYTFGNLMARKAFTVNVPSEEHAALTDYFGIVSGKNTDKFAEAGLTPVTAEHVDAPFIAEFPMVLECRVIQTVDIGLHTQFIGEIVDVKVEEGVVDAEGIPDPKKVKPIVFTPEARNYYGLGEALGPAFSIGKSVKKK